MRHAAGLFGRGYLVVQWLAQRRLLGALLASAVLHGVLLSQFAFRASPRPEKELAPSVLVAHLWMPAPALKEPPVVPIQPTKPAIADPQSTRHTARQPPVSVVNAPSAAVQPNTPNPESAASVSTSAPASGHADRPLDLSPQVISQAVRRSASPSLTQATREQLGDEPAPAAARLGQHIASGAVPDCLHNAPEGGSKPASVAMGGLFALPVVAYAAMTGKCR